MTAIRVIAATKRLADERQAADRLAKAVNEYLGEHDTSAKDYAYRHHCREQMRKALVEFHRQIEVSR